jgi:hypothetical protein
MHPCLPTSLSPECLMLHAVSDALLSLWLTRSELAWTSPPSMARPSSLPLLLRSLSIPTKHAFAISSSGRPSCASFLATVVAGVPCLRRCCRHDRRCLRSGHLKLSRAKPRAPVGAPGDGYVPRHFRPLLDKVGRPQAILASHQAAATMAEPPPSTMGQAVSTC